MANIYIQKPNALRFCCAAQKSVVWMFVYFIRVAVRSKKKEEEDMKCPARRKCA